MIEQYLLKDLCAFLEKLFSEYRLPLKSGGDRAPKIFKGYLPPKRTTGEDDFPLILVRPENGSSDENSSTVNITLIIGVYSMEYDGFEDCFNLMTHVRNALMELPGGVLNRRYIFEPELSWKLPEEQPWPQWFLYVTTAWSMRSPQPIDPHTFKEALEWQDENEKQ